MGTTTGGLLTTPEHLPKLIDELRYQYRGIMLADRPSTFVGALSARALTVIDMLKLLAEAGELSKEFCAGLSGGILQILTEPQAEPQCLHPNDLQPWQRTVKTRLEELQTILATIHV